jgi:hypothetical protein
VQASEPNDAGPFSIHTHNVPDDACLHELTKKGGLRTETAHYME